MDEEAHRAQRRRSILELYNQGRSQRSIADELGVSRSLVAWYLSTTAGYKPRTTTATFACPPGLVVASVAASARGLDLWALCKAIDRGEIPAARSRAVANGVVRVVDEQELDRYIAARPNCAYEGCTRRATIGSHACTGAHARALETAGTNRPYETARRISEGKRGKPRPDVRERVAAMHADPTQRYEWGVRLVEGRAAHGLASVDSLRRWKGRRGGLQKARAAAEAGTIGRPRGYSEEQERAVLALRAKGFSFRAIARIAGLTKQQVERIVARQTEVSRKPS